VGGFPVPSCGRSLRWGGAGAAVNGAWPERSSQKWNHSEFVIFFAKETP